MSALGIGVGTRAELGVRATTNPILDYLGRWVKWIPAEVIAVYAAAVSQMQPEAGAADQTPVISLPLWIIALVATPLIVLVGALLATSGKIPLRMAFSVVAFVVWSSTVPHSPWNSWDLFAQNQIVAYAALAFLSLIFPPLFDRWLGES